MGNQTSGQHEPGGQTMLRWLKRAGEWALTVVACVFGTWLLDPWGGWIAEGNGLADYWRMRLVEALIALAVIGVVLLVKWFLKWKESLDRTLRWEPISVRVPVWGMG